MRHPIYSGVLLGVLGTASVLGECRGLLAFALLLTNYAIKAKKEEQILAARFTDEFREHQSHAGFLLPRLHAHTFD
jgi:protein-S-isoprenylcysteine O-methyltransferase Ste14